MTFDKYKWIKSVQSDTDISDREFRLAVVMASQFVWSNGVGWLVEMDAIGAAVATGYSQSRLGKALGRLCDKGYLVETKRVSTGPGIKAKRAYNLKNTEPDKSHCSDNTDTAASRCFPDSNNTEPAASEHRDASVRTPGPQRPNTGTQGSPQTCSDQPKGASQGSYQGIYQGSLQGGEANDRIGRCDGCGFEGPLASERLCMECTVEAVEAMQRHYEERTKNED